MKILLAAAALLAQLPGPGAAPARADRGPIVPDTVVAVSRGDALSIETWTGTLTVRVGEEDQVRLSGNGESGRVGLIRDGSALRLSGGGRGRSGNLLVEVPRWMPVRVHAMRLDVDVDGAEGGISIQVLEGDLRLRSLSGEIRAQTMSGDIQGWALEGTVVLNALEGEIRVEDARGRIRAESTDGDVELDGVEGTEVTGITVDGDVTFRGGISPAGSLTLTTHDGDVEAWLPSGVEVRVEVSTFDGSFESDFPVRTRGFRAGEPLRFVLGGGGAQVVLQSFDGDIRLLSR